MLRLRFTDGREIPISQKMLVGRALDCDLVLQDPSVSSRHALLENSTGRLFVTDLGSTNGTFVAGQLVAGRSEVGAGVALRFGTLELEVLGAMPVVPAPAGGRTVALERSAPISLCLPNGSEMALFDGLSIGRDPSNTIAFATDSKTSANHARLELRGQAVWLHDLQSRNGTWVNGKKNKTSSRTFA